jgi:hypothetical protein
MSKSNKYPVKIKAGVNYHKMQDMTSRVSWYLLKKYVYG